MALKSWRCSGCGHYNQIDDTGIEWAKCALCGRPHPISVNAMQSLFRAAVEKENADKRGAVVGSGCLIVFLISLAMIWWLLSGHLCTWLKVALSILAFPLSFWIGHLAANAIMGKEEAKPETESGTEPETGGGDDDGKFGTCAYAMELSGGESAGTMGVIPIFQCCKHSKAAQDCEKISGFADFSTGHDENSVEGVAYKLNSTDRCETCGFYKAKQAAAGD